MKLRALAVGLFSFIIISNILTFVYGPVGIGASKQLHEQKTGLLENIQKLEERHLELEQNLVALQNRRDRLAVVAYESGLMEPGDTRVRLLNRETFAQSQSPGSLISVKEPHAVHSIVLSILAFAIGIATGILTNMVSNTSAELSRRRPDQGIRYRKNPLYQGIRVQTASLK